MCANSFTSIGSTALIILNRLRNEVQLRELSGSEEQKNEDAGSDSDGAGKRQDAPDDKSAYVDQYLKDIASFERRFTGNPQRSRRTKID